jgi:hypothetical protein
MLVAGAGLARLLGLPNALALQVIGPGLLLFAATLAVIARAPRVPPRLALAASLADFGWVGGTAILLLVWPDLLSPAGTAVAVGVALVVAAFGTLQLRGVDFRQPATAGLGEAVAPTAGAGQAARVDPQAPL